MPAVEPPAERVPTPELRVHEPCSPELLADLADILAILNDRDPDIIAAVADVDRSLIWEAALENPLERLDRSARNAAYLARLAARR